METLATNGVRWLDFTIHHDEQRGALVAFECNQNLPFDPSRAFCIYNVPHGAWRGGHAHKVCQQVLVALHGQLWVLAAQYSFKLDTPAKGLYVPPGVSIYLTDFWPGTILLVLASEPYDPNDYLYDQNVRPHSRAGGTPGA